MGITKNRLYAGFLSFSIPEIFAGSSPMWIIEPWSWIVTYPLYMAHFLLFTSIAIRFDRTTLPSLYIMGVLFGLYETWITKVVWFGYSHDGKFAVGGIFGFGIHETLALVLFWHPVLSFLLPLAIVSQLSNTDSVFKGTWKLFDKNTRLGKFFYMYVFIAGSVSLAANSGNIVVVAITALPALVVYYFGSKMLTVSDDCYLSLENKWLKIVIGFLILLYVLMYYVLIPDGKPDLLQFGITLVIYVLLIFGLKRNFSGDVDQQVEKYPSNWFFKYFSGLAVTSMVLSVVPPITFAMFIIIILSEILIGPLLFFLIMSQKI